MTKNTWGSNPSRKPFMCWECKEQFPTSTQRWFANHIRINNLPCSYCTDCFETIKEKEDAKAGLTANAPSNGNYATMRDIVDLHNHIGELLDYKASKKDVANLAKEVKKLAELFAISNSIDKPTGFFE